AILMSLPALSTLAVIQNHALYAVGRPTITSVISAARLVVVVAVSVVGTLAVGITGPAIGLVVGFLFELAWKGSVLRPHLSSSPRTLWPHRERLALCVACAGALFVGRVIDAALPQPAGLLVSLVAGTLAFAGA